MNPLPIPLNNSRVGFHYFQDSLHFREIDITTWLPKDPAIEYVLAYLGRSSGPGNTRIIYCEPHLE